MRALAAILCALLTIDAASVAQQPASRLEDRLRDYIARFEQEAAALVAEERYVQRLDVLGQTPAEAARTRELRSDYVLVKPADTEPWLGYRDIFEVDGVPVRERDARVVHILSTTAPDSLARAAAFAREGSRFNLGPERTINTPTLPMQLLARASARRFRLRAPRGWQRQERAVLTFSESSRPTIVRTPEGSGVESRGTMTVRVRDGAILAADLRFHFQGTRRSGPEAVLHVEYGDVPGVAVPVPLRMTEELPMPTGRASGVATYTNYRRFQTSARIR
ncbi:MAG TPA: hypothetical protein VMN81_07905 [Vicinamibacterales bacterium]|nr:hypothetical protein [Vicinamibacterales bacterium]